MPVLRCRCCGTPLVTDLATTGPVTPDAILPFRLDAQEMRVTFARWTASRRFAPRDLKAVAAAAEAEAAYLPFWSFTATRVTNYVGQRGTTHSRTVSTKSHTKRHATSTETWTSWGRKIPGTVTRPFSDVMEPACSAIYGKLPLWPAGEAIPYGEEHRAGFRALQPDVGTAPAYAAARAQMNQTVMSDCKAAIGGNEQRVYDISTSYHDVTYALVLLPMWFLTYTHHGKPRYFVMNGHSGKVKGRRPYSAAKLTPAILTAAALIAVLVYFGAPVILGACVRIIHWFFA
jgi:hypothetical protein